MPWNEPDIPKLAVAYKWLVLWFGIQLVVTIGGGMVAIVLGESAFGGLFALVRLTALLVTIIALVISAYRTASALGSHVGFLWAIAMLIPLLNAITLLVLSARSTKACREAGVEVGFFGPRLETMESDDSEM